MSTVRGTATTIAGRPARLWRGGAATDAPALLFLHGGAPGVTPYCSGAHIWGRALDRLAQERAVLAVDLPGAGGTRITEQAFGFEALVDHVRAVLGMPEHLGAASNRVHLIGHDLGGLIALDLAASMPDRVAAVTAVACAAAAPSGDLVENLTFAHPPVPRYSRASQAWALERIAGSHHWIDASLLDACVEAAAGQPHRDACERMGRNADAFHASVTQAKTRLFERCRGEGIAVPVQIIAGSHDPLTTLEQSLWLFRLVGDRQRVTQLHVINRAGALPFRDDPEAFGDLVMAFASGLHDAPT